MKQQKNIDRRKRQHPKKILMKESENELIIMQTELKSSKESEALYRQWNL
jgi:hypothetical protein